jgi:glutamyl-tRNA synthetase
LPEDALNWAQQLLSQEVRMDPEAKESINAAGEAFLEAIANAIEQGGENYSAVVNAIINATNKKGKNLFMPLRAAVTGKCHGPELAKIFPLMGKALLLERVEYIKKLSAGEGL